MPRLVGEILVDPVLQCCPSVLVDEREHVDSSELRGLRQRPALRLTKVGRHGDHRVRYGRPDVRIGEAGGVVEHHRDNLLEGVDVPVIGADRGRAARVREEVVREEERLREGLHVGKGFSEEVASAGEHLGRVARGDSGRLLAREAIAVGERGEGGGLALGHLVDGDADRHAARGEVYGRDIEPLGAQVDAGHRCARRRDGDGSRGEDGKEDPDSARQRHGVWLLDASQCNGMWEGLGLGDLECEVAGAAEGRTISRTGGRRRGRAIFQFFPRRVCALQ
jgi:hypothetical protein